MLLGLSFEVYHIFCTAHIKPATFAFRAGAVIDLLSSLDY